MPEMLEGQRESWGSRGGFILAAVGSAVGLGNLWGFPYRIYSSGGGAFLIPYILALFVIGIPLLILEFSIGHFTQRAAPDAFRRANKRFEFVGWWAVLLGFVIVIYYPVILAYCFSFLMYSLIGIFNGGDLPWAGKGIEGVVNAKTFFFDQYLQYSQGPELGSVRWNIVLPLVVTWLAMYFSIFKGVRLVGKIVWLTVPIPWFMLLVLAIRGLTLEGSTQGLVYYLDPVWSELARPQTWRLAFGQVFFSLSLAFGVMVTYASFLHRQSDLNNNAAIIGIADFATSFVAGLAVFATLGGMAYATQAAGYPVPVSEVAERGPSLAFVAFPYALAQLPYSAWFSFIFFFALVTLGIDSAFSITESVLASIVDKTGWKRSVVLPVMSLFGLACGLVFVTQGGLNWLGAIDGFVNGIWGIALLGLLQCLMLGWLWRVDILRAHANSRSDWRLSRGWDYLIRMLIPLILGTLFFWQVFENITAANHLRTPQGDVNIFNIVGMSVIGIVPLVALAISFMKGRKDRSGSERPEQQFITGGRTGGKIAFILSIVIAAALTIMVISSVESAAYYCSSSIACFILPFGSLLAMFSSNYLLDKHHTETTKASWYARWAGVLSTMNLSAYSALVLFHFTAEPMVKSTQGQIRDELSGTALVILAAVLVLVVGGLGWCFYKALTAQDAQAKPQIPEQIG